MSPSLSRMEVGRKGWAVKKSLPSVSFPLPMKKLMLVYFNEEPKISAETAQKRILALPQYVNDVFVEYVVTAERIKG